MAADINFRSRRLNVSAVPGDGFSFSVELKDLGFIATPTAVATFGAVTATTSVSYSATTGTVTLVISLSAAQTTTLSTTPAQWTLVVTPSGGQARTFLSGDYVGDPDPIKTTPRAAHRIVPYDSVGTVTVTGGVKNEYTLNGSGQYTPGGTDVPIADGGTGASTEADARDNLQAQRRSTFDVQDYSAVGDGLTDDTTGIQAAITAAAVAGGIVTFDSKQTYLVSTIQGRSNVGLHLNGASINGIVNIDGEAALASVTATGDFATNPVGSSSLAGNFSAFAINDQIVIYQVSGTGSAASGNEIGRHYATVTAASETSVSFTPVTALAFSSPKVMAASWVAMVGAVSGEATVSVPTGAIAGDILRVETTSGTDTPDGSTSPYFELVRLKNVGTGEIEDHLAYSHSSPIVSIVPTITNASVRDGTVSRLTTSRTTGLAVANISTTRLSANEAYAFAFSNINGAGTGADPIVMNVSHSRRGTITGVQASGARGTTDNGSMKFMSLLDSTISNVVARDAGRISGSQSLYPFFMDYYSTPYKGFCQNVTVSGVSAGWTKNTTTRRGGWLIGIRNSTVAGFTSPDGFMLQQAANVVLCGLRLGSGLYVKDTVGGCVINGFFAAFVSVEGGRDSMIGNGVLSGAGSNNSSRTVWVRGGAVVADSDRLRLHDIRSLVSDSSDTATFYLQTATDLVLDGNQDRSGPTNSVQLGSSLGAVHYGLNRFANTIGQSAASNGAMTVPGDLRVGSTAYDRGRLILGSHYLWVDTTGDLRIKSSVPSSDLDGTVVGTQS